MDAIIVVKQMMQLFILIIIGVIVGKQVWLSNDVQKGLSKLVINVTMPCLILSSVMTNTNNQVISIQDILMATFLLVVLLPCVAYFCIRYGPVKSQQGLYMFMIMYPNVGFMGFPLMMSIYGEAAILCTAIINMGFNISLFTLGIIVMNYGQGKNIRLSFKTLLSPGIIASLMAIMIYIVKWEANDVLLQPLTMLAEMTTPLAMILIGALLGQYTIRSIFNDRSVYGFVVFLNGLIPILFYPCIAMFIQNEMIQGITFIILAMPVANSAMLFAHSYHSDVMLAAKVVFLSTLASVVTIPILIALFFTS